MLKRNSLKQLVQGKKVIKNPVQTKTAEMINSALDSQKCYSISELQEMNSFKEQFEKLKQTCKNLISQNKIDKLQNYLVYIYALHQAHAKIDERIEQLNELELMINQRGVFKINSQTEQVIISAYLDEIQAKSDKDLANRGINSPKMLRHKM